MKMAKIFIIFLMLVFAYFFIIDALAEDNSNGHADKKIISNGPIWEITQDGTDKSVHWKDHVPNTRFAIYDYGTPDDETDDIVLDKETGLVWERAPSSGDLTWEEAFYYAYTKCLGGRLGWRIPTVEELSSLLDPNQGYPTLPVGHPFIDIQQVYLTSTSMPTNLVYSEIAFNVKFDQGTVSDDFKSDPHLVWCVRGGYGNIQ